MESTLEKIRRLKARRPQGGSGNRFKGVFHQWKDGDNIIRLAGSFLEVRTHFIAPAPKRNDRGICQAAAFQGENSISSFVNCLDWDVKMEEATRVKTCPICKLSSLAYQILKDTGITDQEKKFFKDLSSSAYAKRNLKWNILDRDDPYVTLVDDSGEKRVLGFKIATIGMEAWNDIEGIFEQCRCDIADPVDGIDIRVVKGSNGTRIVYSAQAVLDGRELKATPFTEEEAALEMHDLKVRCGKMVEAQLIVDALHEDLRELLEMNDDEKALEKESEVATAAVGIDSEPVAEDGDGLMDATSQSATPTPKPAAPARPTPQAPVIQRPTAPAVQKPAPPAAPKSAASLPPRPATPAASKPTTVPTIRRPVTMATSDSQKKR